MRFSSLLSLDMRALASDDDSPAGFRLPLASSPMSDDSCSSASGDARILDMAPAGSGPSTFRCTGLPRIVRVLSRESRRVSPFSADSGASWRRLRSELCPLSSGCARGSLLASSTVPSVAERQRDFLEALDCEERASGASWRVTWDPSELWLELGVTRSGGGISVAFHESGGGGSSSEMGAHGTSVKK